MASVACPECGRVSAARKTCKACGTSLVGIAPLEERSSVPWGKLGVGLVLLVVVVVFCNMASGGRSGRPSTGSSRPAVAPVSDTVRVVYELKGRGKVSVTMENDTGGSEQFDEVLAYKETLTMRRGDFVYISAQIISSNGGNVECTITADGLPVASAEARGFAHIATCSGRVP